MDASWLLAYLFCLFRACLSLSLATQNMYMAAMSQNPAAMMLMPPTETITGLPGYVYWIVGSALAVAVLGPRFMQARREAAQAQGSGSSTANLGGGEA